MYTSHRAELLEARDKAHAAFYASEVFGGPSLHFHLRSLAAAQDHDLPLFAETSYAMLAAWGMHRMGNGGAKMGEFSQYKASLGAIWPTLLELQTRSPSSLTENDWQDMELVFSRICVMRSSFSLVGHSKIMAHVIPRLIPPVDRQYTIRFLHGAKKLPVTIAGEWALLRCFLENFFYPLLSEQPLMDAINNWSTSKDIYPWNTSPLKVIDNLLVGHAKAST